MWERSILTILYLFVALTCAAPTHDSDSSEEDGIVYIFNIYAVKQMKTQAIGKILEDENTIKMPSNFQSVGSLLFPDPDGDEPLSMKDLAFYMEEMGFTYEQLNEGDEPKILEVKYDSTWIDFDDLEAFEEVAKALRAEGIILELVEENGLKICELKFDESIKKGEDQPFTLAELGEMFEKEGFTVEYVRDSDGQVIKLKMTIDEDENEEPHTSKTSTTKSSSEVKSEKKDDNKIGNDKKNEKKVEKNDEKQRERKNEFENQFFPLDFTTKSESLNKLRRRRSACRECKAAGMIKTYLEKYELH